MALAEKHSDASSEYRQLLKMGDYAVRRTSDTLKVMNNVSPEAASLKKLGLCSIPTACRSSSQCPGVSSEALLYLVNWRRATSLKKMGMWKEIFLLATALKDLKGKVMKAGSLAHRTFL